MTHISFVSMWFSGSCALAVFAQCVYFFWLPYWRNFLIFNICYGIGITLLGACILAESPMHNLLKSDVEKASQSLEYIKKFNRMGGSGRKIDLKEFNQRLQKH